MGKGLNFLREILIKGLNFRGGIFEFYIKMAKILKENKICVNFCYNKNKFLEIKFKGRFKILRKFQIFN